MSSQPGVPRTAPDGRLICEICGKTFLALGKHVSTTHGISVREYQIEYGLPVSKGIMAQESRALKSQILRDIHATKTSEEKAAVRDRLREHNGHTSRDPEMLRRGTTLRPKDHSAKIAETLRKKVPPIECVTCGKSFRPKDRRVKTCSPECSTVLRSTAATLRDPKTGLTPRETQIMALLDSGLTQAEIGRKLGLHKATISSTIKSARKNMH